MTAVVTGGGGTTVTTAAGQYGGLGPFDAKLVVAGDIDLDALIEFFVNGAPADQTANYRAGRATELNLSVPGPASYGLSLSSSEGGAVTNPGEGPFLYEEGTVVPLEATADGCY